MAKDWVYNGALGERLRNELHKKNVIPRQAAKEMGIGVATLSANMTGKTYPDLDILAIYSKYFDISIYELVDLTIQDRKSNLREQVMGYANNRR